ncbi:MAG: hypothetical protein ACI35S_08885 [Anaeroplasma sp.]
MKKEKKSNSLVLLYINYIFQKTTIIILFVSLVLISFFLIISTNPWTDNNDYLLYYNEIHSSYLMFGLFIVQIFNSIIISSITISLTGLSTQFDYLFVSYTPRTMICLSKIAAMTIIFIFLTIIEVIIMFLIGLAIYTNFTISICDFKVILYLIISEMFEGVFSIFMNTLFTSIITPLIVTFLFIIERLLCNNFYKINELISKIFPIINIKNNEFICESFYTGLIWILLVLLFYITVYNIKDL